MEEKSNKKGVSRRKFIKGGAMIGAVAALSGMTNKKDVESVAKAIGKKELSEFPLKIDESKFKRFGYSSTAFSKPELAEGLPGLFRVIDNSKPGYTSLDWALALASGAGDEISHYAFEGRLGPHKYEFSSKEDATTAVKRAAKFYGADLVGITHYDERWNYDPIYIDKTDGNKVYGDDDLPFKPKSVVVMALEMDYEGMSSAPSTLEAATSMLGYSHINEVSHKVATFLRNLGYQSFAHANDFALSVPYGIAAGLGEIGRQGLLITYEFGPRVRLVKVFTELELAFDKPITFGATAFCRVCKKCATTCPSQSITLEDDMTWEGYSSTNTVGIEKYYVNTETCYQQWNRMGNDCGVCVTACPYNKPNFWHHRITTALTATPLKPFLNEMDDVFGYGDVYNEETCINFWGLEKYTF